jgi:hypothetical protein
MQRRWRRAKPRRLVSPTACALVSANSNRAGLLSVELLEDRNLLSAVPGGDDVAVTVANSFSPQVSIAPDGSYTVVYLSGEYLTYDVSAQRFGTSGAPVGGQISVSQSSSVLRPTVATDATGNYVVAWESDGQDGDGKGITARQFSADGTPIGNEFTVNTTTAGSQQSPSMAINASGQFVIAWSGDTAFGNAVAGRAFAADGTPLGNEFFVGTGFSEPSLSMDGSGAFVATWGQSQQITGQRFDMSGTPVGSTFQLGAQTAISSRTVGDANGNLLAVWSQQVSVFPSEFGILAQRFDSDGVPQSDVLRLNTNAMATYGNFSVSMNSSQEFIVAWEDSTNDVVTSVTTIYAARFGADNVAIGPNLQLNTSEVLGPAGVTIALNDDQDFAVAFRVLSHAQTRLYLSEPPPKIVVGSQSGFAFEDGAIYPFAVREIVATFDKEMDTTGGASGAHSVINPANWDLTANGQDANGLITDIVWDQSTFRAVITLSAPLLDGNFSLRSLASMQDAEGHALDGNGDGTGGDDYQVSFSVAGLASLGEI